MRFVRLATPLICLLLLCLSVTTFGGSALAQEQPPAQPQTIATLKGALDEIEQALGKDDVDAQSLANLRTTLIATHDAIRARIAELEPRVAEIEARVKELGPAPEEGQPEESADLKAEREKLNADLAELSGELKQGRLLSVRGDQLTERLSERRHALYARELLARSQSIIDPNLWIDAVNTFPREVRTGRALVSYWYSTVLARAGWVKLALGALIFVVSVVVAIVVTARFLPRLDAGPSLDTPYNRARAAFGVFMWLSFRNAMVALVCLLSWTGLGLLTPRIEQIGEGIVVGILAAAFGRGVARGLFAPDRPSRRLLALNDVHARWISGHLVWSSRLLGLTIFLQVVHKTLYAPLAVTVATNALFALLSAVLLVHFLLRMPTNGDEGAVRLFPGAQGLGLIIAAVITGAVVGGYTGLAAFFALRTIVAAAVFGALYLLLFTTKVMFAQTGEPTARRIALANRLGVGTGSLEMGATLISAAIRLVLILVACVVIIGPWEVSTADLFDTARNVPFGFKIGEINVSLRAIIASIALLVVLIAAWRVARRWLETEFLPRTTLEPSLQLSIVTIFNYVGFIVAVAVALSALGIDLQKIALIAGALSVGIGFGLQSIVSNFVSGLILLAERPIRVGDAVTVKGEEGWVRRVRVRATEVETYDRATVIIPNSEFITGVVKNWTHSNTLGRVIIKVTVPYTSDPEQVRDMLLDIARSHPLVVQQPGPSAVLANLGDQGLEFELRCIVTSNDRALSIKSDLNYAVLRRLREAGIPLPSSKDMVARPPEPLAPGLEPLPKGA